MIFRRKFSATLLFVAMTSLSLTACDQLRERLASVTGSKSPQEALTAVRSNLENGKFKEAKAEAEPQASKPGAHQAEFALVAAQACANLGEVGQALDYLVIALKAGTVSSDALMVDRNFESIRTDIRFVALLTGQANSASAGSATASATSTAQAASEAKAAAPTTAIRMDSQGIEVKAGSISIKLPK